MVRHGPPRSVHRLLLASVLALTNVPPSIAAEPAADIGEAGLELQWAMRLRREGPDTAENSAELLAAARDGKRPAGVRAQALKAYGAMAGRRHEEGAAQAIWELRGQIQAFGDPAIDALADLGTSALPFLATLLPGCDRREQAPGRLDDPTSTIVIEEAGLAAAAIVQIVDHDATATAPGLASSLIGALDCGSPVIRQVAARALGLLERIDARESEALRRRVANDRHADVRAFSTSVLAAHGLDDARTLKVLARALSDRAEVVRLGAANALVKLKRFECARATLAKLKRSRDPEIAQLAASLLAGQE
jgi:hypothetical protein